MAVPLITKLIKDVGVPAVKKIIEKFAGGLNKNQMKTKNLSQFQKSVKQGNRRNFAKGSATTAGLTAIYESLSSKDKQAVRKEIEQVYAQREKDRQANLEATAKKLENEMTKKDPIGDEIRKNTPRPRKRPDLNKGGMAKKPRTGHMDYRKGGMVYGKK